MKKESVDKIIHVAGLPFKGAIHVLWVTFKALVLVVMLCGVVGGGLILGAVAAYVNNASELTSDDFIIESQVSYIYDDHGQIIHTMNGSANRLVVDYEDVPKDLINAFIAIEDQRFWSHNGVDLKRTLAAGLSYIVTMGNSSFGGSTITQQLIKNISGNWENSIQRKIQEQYMALSLEKQMTKAQIITSYMNVIYMGSNIYGVEAASRYYFGKSVGELSLAECASLAGITNSPGKYAPVGPITRGYNKERQEIVLAEMLRQGLISKAQYDQAIAEELQYILLEEVEEEKVDDVQSWFVDAVIYEAIYDLMELKDWSYSRASLAVYNGGMHIYSTQSTEIQNAMTGVFTDPKVFPMNAGIVNRDLMGQAAMVILDPYTGYVKGVYSGYGEKDENMGLNLATSIYRQPGSTWKPIGVYAPLLDAGVITAGTVIDDAPSYLNNATPDSIYPSNYDSGDYHGLTTIHDAVMYSINVVAAKSYMMSPPTVYPYIDKMGLNRDDEVYVSYALGGLNVGTNPLQMAGAYATFVNDGVWIEPTFYTMILDSEGKPVVEKSEQKRNVVFSEETAFIMTDIMSDVSSPNGTASDYGHVYNASGEKIPTAGKTGTSSGWKDKWFLCYTPYYVGAVWYGYTQNTTIPGSEYGMAKLVWSKVMNAIHKDLAVKSFDEATDQVVSAQICKCSGKLVSDLCKQDPRGTSIFTTEYYIKGTEPTEVCDAHVECAVCSTSGQLATAACPSKKFKVYIVRDTVKPGDSKPYDYWYRVPEKQCTTHSAGSTSR